MMKNELMVFENESMEIRTIKKNGEVWFVAKDVSNILGYSDTQAMTRRLDDDELMTDKLSGMNMKSTLINESGLYSSILGSKKPEAKAFKRWVTSEVLPAIRKDGGYIVSNEEDTPEVIMAKAVMVAQATIERNKERILELENKAELNKPLVEFSNQVADSSDCIDMGTFAKLVNDEDVKIGRNKLFKLLRDKGVLMKANIPYQKYIDNGCFKTVEQSFKTPYGNKLSVKTLITGVGQIKLVSKLKEWVNS